MKHRIHILAADLKWTAELLDNETGSAIWEALPIEGKVHRWGEEIYFEIPVKLPEASDARQEMAVGELAYWPVGAAFCIFFGPTPVSVSGEPRAYSNVNPCGRLLDDPISLSDVRDGAILRLERIE